MEELCTLVAGGWCWLGGCHSHDGSYQVTSAGRDLRWGAGTCSVLWTSPYLVCGFEDLQISPGVLGQGWMQGHDMPEVFLPLPLAALLWHATPCSW